MVCKIRLKDIIGEALMQSPEWFGFLDTAVGEIVWVSSEELRAAENGLSIEQVGLSDLDCDLAEQILENEEERFIRLPTPEEVDEYGIMQDFVYLWRLRRCEKRCSQPSGGREHFDVSKIQSSSMDSKLPGTVLGTGL